MPKGLFFWLLMVLWLVLGFFAVRPSTGQPWTPVLAGFHFLLFVLLFLLGWAVFGFVIQ